MRKICLDSFPELLTRHDFWHPANEKKIPTKPNSEVPVTGDRLAQCLPFAQVEELVQRGIHAFAVYLHNEREPYITLDLDKARDPQKGRPLPWVMPLFAVLGITEDIYLNGVMSSEHPYIEVSWSKTGYHVLMKGQVPFGKRLWLVNGKQATGKDQPKIEVLARNCAITYTGDVLPGSGQQALPVEPLLNYLRRAYPDQHCESAYIKKASRSGAGIPEWRGHDHKELSPEQVADMLDRINPDCDHDEWKQIGMAINSWDPGHVGKELWSQWSQGGSKFGAGTQKEINSAWKSFKPGKGIGIGSVVKKAQEAGYQFPRPAGVKNHDKEDSAFTIPLKVDQTTTAGKADQKKNKKKEKDKENAAAASPPALTVVPDPPVPITDQVALSNAIRDGINAVVDRYNKVFVHSRVDSKNFVMKLEDDDEHQQATWQRMTFPEFRELLIHEQPIPVSEDEDAKGKKKVKYASPAQVWLTSKEANFIPCSTFYPELSEDWPPTHDGKLNLYRGFAVEPMLCTKADQCVKRWLYHMRTVVCQDDDVAYQYLMNWFAHLIQRPWEKPQTAIILKGEQGTGKNLALKPIMKILGVHALYIERPGAVSGKHNKIMDNRTLIFADEAAFHNASDSRILRALITETSSAIEPKGIDSYSQRNFLRIIMATNSDSAIRFASDERRFVVLELSTCHKQDLDYFGELVNGINNGLPEKLLHLFQQRDISQFLPMDIPQTKYLTEGKINNLEPQQAFVYEALVNGSFTLNAGWPSNFETSVVQTWFQEWLDKKRIKFKGDIGRKLGRVLSGIGVIRRLDREGLSRGWCYYFKDLENSRHLFVQKVLAGSVIIWGSKET